MMRIQKNRLKLFFSNGLPLYAALIALIVLSSVSQRAYAQVIIASPGKKSPLDGKTRTAIIDSITTVLNEVYVFPEKADEMEAYLQKRLKSGEYDKITDIDAFAQVLTEDMRSICHDRHLSVQPLPPPRPGRQDDSTTEERQKRFIERLRSENFGFKKIEIFPENIGYLDLRMFVDAVFAGETAVAAMNFLSNTDAVIIDLRQNGGGSPSMIQLIMSYFFDEPVHLNSFYIRKDNSTKQFWTQAQVQGPRMPDVPIYILTSHFTFSAAEEFTYNFKNLKRATIIGETTGGGAHPTEAHAFPGLPVQISVPFGRAINPISGTNWEGTGVEPDIVVPAEKALFRARKEIIRERIAREEDAMKKRRLEWTLENLEIEENPVHLELETLKEYEGVYGPRTVFLKGGELMYKRGSQPGHKLVPMGNDMFMLEGLPYFRLRFVRDESGRVTEAMGMYDNGVTDSTKRTEN